MLSLAFIKVLEAPSPHQPWRLDVVSRAEEEARALNFGLTSWIQMNFRKHYRTTGTKNRSAHGSASGTGSQQDKGEDQGRLRELCPSSGPTNGCAWRSETWRSPHCAFVFHPPVVMAIQLASQFTCRSWHLQVELVGRRQLTSSRPRSLGGTILILGGATTTTIFWFPAPPGFS